MSKSVVIAVDAMGGDNSPNKIIAGISEFLKKNNNVFFRIFGKKIIIENEISKNSIKNDFYEIIDCEDIVENNDTPLSAAKKKIQVCGNLLTMLKKKILM